MNTLRNSFRVAAMPGSVPTISTGMPSAPKRSANATAPAPETSVGVPSPRAAPVPSARRRQTPRRPADDLGHFDLHARARRVQVREQRSVDETGPAIVRRNGRGRARVDAQHDLHALHRRLSARRAPDRAGLSRRVGVPAADVRSERGKVRRDPAARFAQAEDGDAKTVSEPASHLGRTVSRSLAPRGVASSRGAPRTSVNLEGRRSIPTRRRRGAPASCSALGGGGSPARHVLRVALRPPQASRGSRRGDGRADRVRAADEGGVRVSRYRRVPVVQPEERWSCSQGRSASAASSRRSAGSFSSRTCASTSTRSARLGTFVELEAVLASSDGAAKPEEQDALARVSAALRIDALEPVARSYVDLL